jgi:hemerythrin-like domain-containing protein
MLRDPSLIPLSRQHQHGLALCVLTRRALEQNSSAENVAAVARRIADQYDIELANHFEVEEQVLFPACGNAPIVAELIAEHRRLEAMVAGLRTSATVETLLAFCDLLSAHIRREERVLFEDIQQTLPRDTMDRLGGEIDRRLVRVCL